LVERAHPTSSYRQSFDVSYQGKSGLEGRFDTLICAKYRKADGSNRQQPANSGHLVSKKTGAIHFYYGLAGLAG